MFRFRLRTLFIALTVLSVAAAITGWMVHSHQMREAAIAKVKELKGQTVRESKSKKVTRVYLAGAKIDDTTLAMLIDYLKYLGDMSELDLVRAAVTDDGIESLSQLPQLEELYLFETPVTEKGIAKLQKLMPNLVIKTEQPEPIASKMVSMKIYPHAITALAGSPDQKRIATGDGAGTVRLWNPELAEPVQQWRAHKEWVFDIDYSPDGTTMATAGDNVVKLWNRSDQKLIHTFTGPGNDVHDVAFTPDGKLLIAASDDRLIRIWDTDSKALLNTLAGHERQIPRIALSPSGKILASASRDKTVRLWDIPSGKSIGVLSGHQEDVMAVCFDSEGSLLASGDETGKVRLWDAQSLELITEIDTSLGSVFDVAIDGNKNMLVGCGANGIQSWELTSGICQRFVRGKVVSRLSVAADKNYLLTTNIAGELKMRDRIELNSLRVFRSMYGERGLYVGPARLIRFQLGRAGAFRQLRRRDSVFRFVQIRVHRWVVVHFHLAIRSMAKPASENVLEQLVQAVGQVIKLHQANGHPVLYFFQMLGRRVSAGELLVHVIDSQCHDRHAVDDTAGRF